MTTKVLRIPLNGGLFNRRSEFTLEPGMNVDVVNLRSTRDEGVMHRSPAIDPTPLLTWATASIAPGAFVPCSVGPGALFIRPEFADYQVSSAGVRTIDSTMLGPNTSSRPNAWFPAQVTRARTSLIINSPVPNVAVETSTSGYRVIAATTQKSETSLSRDITITVEDPQGEVLVAPLVVASMGTLVQDWNIYPIALTRHSSDRIALWYHVWPSSGNPTIKLRLLTISSTGVSVGVERTVVTPAFPSPFAVDSIGNSVTAFLAHVGSAGTERVDLKAVDVTNGTTDMSRTWPLEVPKNNTQLAVAAIRTPADERYVAVGWISGSGVTRGAILNYTTFASQSSVATRISSTAFSNTLAVRWGQFSAGSAPHVVWVASDTVTGTGSYPRTHVAFSDANDANTNTLELDGVVPISQGGQWSISDAGLTFPLFPMVRLNQTGSTPYDTTYVIDPSIEVYAPRLFTGSNSWVMSSIARLGVDNTFGMVPWSHRSLTVHDNVASFVYPTFRGDRDHLIADSVKLTDISLWSHLTSSKNPGPAPAVAPAGAGTIIAGAQPMVWDGRQLTEVGFPHRPFLTGTTIGGTGPNLTGNFTYYAVASWYDWAGQKHRSAPSQPVTLSPSGTACKLWVSALDTVRNGLTQQVYNIEIYGTANDGDVAYMLPSDDGRVVPTAKSSGMYQYTWITSGTAGTPALFSDGSDGSELYPEAPGAMWDACAVNDRIWYIDAENRNVLRYSKRKQQGIAYEFNANLFMVLGADAGDAIAIKEFDGRPIAFCANGIYTMYGEGPSNTGTGTSFSAPQCVWKGSISPSGRNAVTRTPQGILFETTRGYAVLRPGMSVDELDAVDVPSTRGLWSIHSQVNDEVYNFSDSEGLIYDLNDNAWTHWYPNSISGSLFTCGITSQGTGSRPPESMYLVNDRSLYVVRDTTLSDSGSNWSITTGWIAPEGEVGATSFQNFYLSGIYFGTGSTVSISQLFDYSSTVSATTTFSASIVAERVNGTEPTLITLHAQSVVGHARAVKLIMSESGVRSGRGFIPIALTITHSPVSEIDGLTVGNVISV